MATLFSDKIKALREKLGVPQRKLAAAIDIDTATYSKIENGLYLPKKEMVIALAEFFKCDADELLKYWMAEKISSVAGEDKGIARDALKIVEETLK